ncbi:putative SP-containing membrane protein [Vairimorpha necatrix]|uniref:SP-containing membrane protein n=1 Tax=Vairimorpha necatrix TaxID=6039 RepID=A0AAX4JGA0_9MICR
MFFLLNLILCTDSFVAKEIVQQINYMPHLIRHSGIIVSIIFNAISCLYYIYGPDKDENKNYRNKIIKHHVASCASMIVFWMGVVILVGGSK